MSYDTEDNVGYAFLAIVDPEKFEELIQTSSYPLREIKIKKPVGFAAMKSKDPKKHKEISVMGGLASQEVQHMQGKGGIGFGEMKLKDPKKFHEVTSRGGKNGLGKPKARR